MPGPVDYRDCSRATLEAFEDGLVRDIAAGRNDLQPKLDAVRAQLPHAPLYDVSYRSSIRTR